MQKSILSPMICLSILSLGLLTTLPAFTQSLQNNTGQNVGQNKQLVTGQITPRIGVSPQRIELQLNDSGQANGEFTVLNVSQSPLDIQLSVHHWDLDKNNNTRIIEPTEQSLDQWLIINPLRFRVEAQNNQVIRFGVRPRVKPEIGEHRAIVYIREIPNEDSQQVNVRVAYGLPIYANYGEVKRVATIHQSSLSKKQGALFLDIEMSNPGKFYTRPKGAIAVWQSDQYPGDKKADTLLAEFQGEIENAVLAQPILSKPILPDYRRNHITRMLVDDLEKGNYTARVYAQIGDNIVKRTLSFTQ